MKRGGFGLGPSGPAPEELEKEAAAELRRAMAGSEPRRQGPRTGLHSGPRVPEPEVDLSDEDDADEGRDAAGPEWRSGLTVDEERRAVTELAMQQLSERPFGSVRPEDTLSSPSSAGNAEDIRNKALADFLERQQQMARDRPVASPRANRAANPVVQRTSGVTISPNLTVKPTLSSGRPSTAPELDELAARSRRSNRPDGIAAADRVGASAADGGEGNGRPSPRRVGSPATSARSARSASDAARGEPPDPVSSLDVSPAVRSRPVQRRAGTRATLSPAEPEARWRALAELADLLAQEVFPGDALPEVARWLAGTTSSSVAIMLLTDDAIDDVVAWPTDEPLAEELCALIGQPLDEHSTIWVAVSDGRMIAGPHNEHLNLPEGVTAADVGGWAVVPILDRTVVFGALLVTRAYDEIVPASMAQLAEEVAQRVARALLNCEEAANSGANGGTGDADFPQALRDRLGALCLALDAVVSFPRPRLVAEQARQFGELTQQATRLETHLQRLLTGDGGARS